jgi:hypothetical protein
MVGNIGGSMDLVSGAKRLFIAMEHVTPNGEFNIVKDLTYPATGIGKVNKIFTDLVVIEVVPEGLLLQEICPGLTTKDIQSVTGAELIISPSLKPIEL